MTLAVFGSRAQGTSKPESDLDLLVVIRGLPHSRMKRRRLILPRVEGQATLNGLMRLIFVLMA